MNQRKFRRNKEDFTCQNCGTKIIGTGYTNHCPKCFYSKHVDINPGDRAAVCQGLMRPLRLEYEHGQQYIAQQCLDCGFIRRQKLAANDDLEELAKIVAELAKE